MLPLGLAEAMGEMQLIINDDKLISDRKTEFEQLSRLQDIPSKSAKEILEHVTIFGGFPEPFLRANNRFSNKWRRDYKSLLLSAGEGS